MIPINDSFKPEFIEIIPIEPVYFEYNCGKEYVTTQLDNMIQDKISIGIIIIDGKDCTIASIINSKIIVHKKMTSGLSGKHRSGGQSASRFERLHEEGIREFHKRIAEKANIIFSEIKMDKLIISGCSNSKNDFINAGLLKNEISKKIIAIIDVGYNGEHGIRETIERSSYLLADLEFNKEKEIYNRFFGEIINDSSLAIYGKNEVFRNLSMGKVDTLLLSDEISILVEEFDIEENLRKFNTKIEVISNSTDEGYALLHTFGGIAGILRY